VPLLVEPYNGCSYCLTTLMVTGPTGIVPPENIILMLAKLGSGNATDCTQYLPQQPYLFPYESEFFTLALFVAAFFTFLLIMAHVVCTPYLGEGGTPYTCDPTTPKQFTYMFVRRTGMSQSTEVWPVGKERIARLYET